MTTAPPAKQHEALSRDADRLAQIGFIACLALSGITILISLLSPLIGGTLTGIAAFLALIVWIWIGAPLHLALLLHTLVRTWQGQGRRLLIVWAYLASVLICSVLMLFATGLDKAVRDTTHEWARQVTDRAQVKLETGIRGYGPDALEAMRDALAGGADPDGDLQQMPMLVRAAMRGELAKVRLLLDAGADPNRPAVDGISDHLLTLGPFRPLDAALFQPQPDQHAVMQALLDAGADPAASPLRLLACARDDAELYRRLASLPPGPKSDAAGTHCLHLIARRGYTKMLAEVRDDIGDPNTRDGGGSRPLDLALHNKHDEVALAIIGMGGRAERAVEIERALARTDTDSAYLALRTALATLPTDRQN